MRQVGGAESRYWNSHKICIKDGLWHRSSLILVFMKNYNMCATLILHIPVTPSFVYDTNTDITRLFHTNKQDMHITDMQLIGILSRKPYKFLLSPTYRYIYIKSNLSLIFLIKSHFSWRRFREHASPSSGHCLSTQHAMMSFIFLNVFHSYHKENNIALWCRYTFIIIEQLKMCDIGIKTRTWPIATKDAHQLNQGYYILLTWYDASSL